MRIAIIGYSGSGKSTLADKLGKAYGIPVQHLDGVFFEENWKPRDRQAALADVQHMLDEPCWVIDGNYTGLLQPERLARADQIVFLNFSRWICLYRVTKRYRRYRGATRPDLAPGCNEKLDLEFVRWVLFDGRTRQKCAHYRSIVRQYADKTVILCNQRALDAFCSTLLNAEKA